MTNAIFFNTMRGSGREVTINLIESGIEIVSMSGEHIAVWTYPVIDLVKESRVPREGSFVVDHDEIHLLQIFDRALWDQVTTRAPLARKTERRMTSYWFQLWLGMPDTAAGGIWLLVIITLGWIGREAYRLLFPS